MKYLIRLYKLLRDLTQALPSRTRHRWVALEALEKEKPTVVLVSGLGATRRSLEVIRKRLLKDGYNVVIVPMDWHALSDSYLGLYRMSTSLSSMLTKIHKQLGSLRKEVFLVAHSAGGLVARHYIQRLGGDHYCDGLVTLGTPHRGTWIALLGLISPLILKVRCLLQMLPYSHFITELNRTELPSDFPLLSLYSRGDWFCPPRTTRLPPGWKSMRGVQSQAVGALSHGELLLSKKMYSHVLEALQNMTHRLSHQRLPLESQQGDFKT